ncbi:PP2C family protein-serine/threonine phosphatase [Kineococcus sp. SYSU DK004]|uniref:PP2C family protein-serine/threonine phosphatase n=1 Tax=Kineococcus sp. SYSU DK004 TaxID=3383125 RepID=UPI003D7EDBC1
MVEATSSTGGGARDVARVVSERAAVVVVDTETGAVVHANAAAVDLAPGTRLPVAVGEWSAAVRLRSPDGAPCPPGRDPLALAARGRAVGGAVVGVGLEVQQRWVVAVPLEGTPGLHRRVLVTLLPVEAGPPGEDEGSRLRDRAVLATALSFTVADAQTPDMPLVWVNPAFTVTTGYAFEEVVGRNCRFLQGPGTDPAAPREVRETIRAGRDGSTTLLNYRKDGSAFWNELALSPVRDGAGTVTHYVGIQLDVTERVVAGQERDRALAAERRARRDAEVARAEAEASRASAERARARLELLAGATTRLAGALGVAECLRALADLVVPVLADRAVVLAADGREAVAPAAPAAGWPEAAVRRVREVLRERPAGGEPAEHAGAAAALGARSALVVPLEGRERTRDVLVLLRDGDAPALGAGDRRVAGDLARRAGLILDNARLYEQQHEIAETLQASLLPALPVVPGLRAAARYRAAASGAQVGGDFYELVPLPGGAVGLAVGDVVGHDVLAAAAMGHLRGLLRASAWEFADRPPARVLERVDDLLLGLGIPTMATLAYARLSPRPDGGWRLEHSSAGHPPLLVRTPDGAVRVLSEAGDLLLGVRAGRRVSATVDVPEGSVVVGYTDGLVERRGEVLSVGLERVRAAVASGPADPDALCEHLLSTLGGVAGAADDVAVLAVEVRARPAP